MMLTTDSVQLGPAVYRLPAPSRGGDEHFHFSQLAGWGQYLSLVGFGGALLFPPCEATSHGGELNGHPITNCVGYDAISNRIAPCFGGETALTDGIHALQSAGLAAWVDVVFNHVSRYYTRPWEDLFDSYHDPQGQQRRIATFFGYDHLPRVRSEDPVVRERAFGPLRDLLVKHGCGARVDHSPGFRDRSGTLEWLQVPHVVEEVHHRGEETPEGPDNFLGTSGLEYVDLSTHLALDRDGAMHLDQDWRKTTGQTDEFWQLVEAAKRWIAENWFAADLRRAIAELDQPLTVAELARGLASMDTYRVYIEAGRPISQDDTRQIRTARLPDWLKEGTFDRRYDRFWALIGPIQAALDAKACEDWALYVYTSVLGMNDVNISRQPLSIDGFHAAVDQRYTRWPQAWKKVGNHDSKWSPATRAMMLAATHRPKRYLRLAQRLQDASMKYNIGNALCPRVIRYVFEVLIATWPLDGDPSAHFMWRLLGDDTIPGEPGFFRRAARQARLDTNWWDSNHQWEEQLRAFVRAVCDDPACRALLMGGLRGSFRLAQELLLSQQLVQLMTPGVAALYSGFEYGMLGRGRRVMDPDNRRPVPLQQLKAMLDNRKQYPVLDLTYTALNVLGTRLDIRNAKHEPILMPPGHLAFRRGPVVVSVCLTGGHKVIPPGCKDKADLLKEFRGQGLYWVG